MHQTENSHEVSEEALLWYVHSAAWYLGCGDEAALGVVMKRASSQNDPPRRRAGPPILAPIPPPPPLPFPAAISGGARPGGPPEEKRGGVRGTERMCLGEARSFCLRGLSVSGSAASCSQGCSSASLAVARCEGSGWRRHARNALAYASLQRERGHAR